MNKHQFFLHKEFLERAISGLNCKTPVLIYGAFGSGKSPFVDKLISEYDKHNPQIVWVRINFGDFPREIFETQVSLLRKIVMEMAKRTEPDLDAAIESYDANSVYTSSSIATLEFFTATIQKLDRILILVLENVHEIIDMPYRNDFFDNLRGFTGDKDILDKFGLIISMISDVEEVQNLSTASPFINASVGINLSTLNDRQISDLLASEGLDNSEETITMIKELIGGNLYLISLLIENAAETDLNIREVLQQPDVGRFFDSRIEHLRALVSKLDGGRQILNEFKEQDVVSIHSNNLNKKIYDDLAKIGVLSRENKEIEILYTIQGNRLKHLMDENFIA